MRLRTWFALATGAGLAYLLDPESGRARRAAAVRQIARMRRGPDAQPGSGAEVARDSSLTYPVPETAPAVGVGDVIIVARDQ